MGASSLPGGLTAQRGERAVGGLPKAASLPGWASRRRVWNHSMAGAFREEHGEDECVEGSWGAKYHLGNY